ncbi:MAG: MATE family efflux transporter [Bacteroidota bacterium]
MDLQEHLRRNVKLAAPVMIGQLGHIMVSVADTAMVGQVGVIPLAASTFAGTFFHVFMLFGIGVSYAITPLTAATDPTDQPQLLKYLQNGLLVNGILGVTMVLLSLAILPFLGYFGQEAPVAEAARGYLLIVSLSLFPVMIFQSFRQFSEGLSNTFIPMVVSITANLLNVLLNYLLIFGKFGFPEMGLNGAALATLISRLVMAVLMILLSRKQWVGFSWSFDRMVLKRVVKLGVPSGMQYIFEVGAFATAAIMVGWLGAEQLAAHQIALNLAAISYMAATGIAAAAQIRVANQKGLNDIVTLRQAGYSCYLLTIVFMGFCGLMMVIFNYELPSLYIGEESVRQIASSLLFIAAAFQISDGCQAVGLGILRGLTDVRIPTYVTFFAFFVLAIPGGYLLGFTFGLGVQGIWYALLMGLTVGAILHVWRFQLLTKRLMSR